MTKHPKNKFVKDIKSGENVKDIFVVAEKEPLKDYLNGQKWMFSLLLKDKTGTIKLKFFGSNDKSSVEKTHSSLSEGGVVLVDATAKEYNGSVEFTVNPPQQTIQVLKAEEYDREHFIQRTKKDMKKLQTRLKELIDMITDTDIKKLMTHIFSEEMSKKFSESSAAVKRHHAFVGGLLEHSISLAEILLILKQTHPELNQDYLICGALLQDIGKTAEITGDIAFDFTTEGSLVGHIVLGAQIVGKAAEEIGTPKEKTLKLVHLVLSHHNELEYGSPVTPKFPEAAAVAYADMLDAKTQEFIDAYENAKNASDNETEWDKNLKRFIFLK